MYSNKILNFQVSTTILMSGNLLKVPRTLEKGMNFLISPPQTKVKCSYSPVMTLALKVEIPLNKRKQGKTKNLEKKGFVTASHQTRLDTRSMTRRSIKVGIRGGEVGFEPRLEPC